MFQIVVVIVASLLEASCVSSTLVSVNDPGGHRCYSCPSVEEPYLCNVTTQCRHDEQCYTDEYSTNHGGSIFSVGCRRNADCHAPIIVGRSVPSMRDVENLKCEECCQGDLCNGGGCSAGIGKGNVCYSCNLLQDPRQCKHEKRCQANEHCYIEKVFTQHYHIKFNLGCVENAECERLRHFGPPVGKRDKSISTMCASCCYGDKCNDVCFLNGSLATTRPLATTQTTLVDTVGTLYISSSMNIHATPVYTTNLASSSSPSSTTDTTVTSSSVIPLAYTYTTPVYRTNLASSSSPLTTIDTTVTSSSVNPLAYTYTTPVYTTKAESSSAADTTIGSSSAIPLMSIDRTFVHKTTFASPSSHSTTTNTIGLPSPTSSLMNIDSTPVDTASRIPPISPSVRTAAPVLYTARGTPYISPSMSTAAAVVDIKTETSSSSPQRISTAFLDLSQAPSTGPSMNTNTASTNGVQSSLLAASSVQELSTVRYGITASPFTSTAQSTHGTSHLKELSTICHADCDGVSGCILPKIQTCSGATPYCFTQVNNNYSGNFNIKKRCADRTTCNTKWWQQTSDEDRCVNYKQGTMDTFTCFYCCTADRCNLNNIKPTSLFKGDA
ncbi:uncharacterized protein [Haliotis asinina]|uniref:uncharacterized protein isoform X1 n=1 Tax=Haliotis asinina TaxID=109174 RepID=UPI003531EE40